MWNWRNNMAVVSWDMRSLLQKWWYNPHLPQQAAHHQPLGNIHHTRNKLSRSPSASTGSLTEVSQHPYLIRGVREEKWQEQVPKVSLPEGQLVRDQGEATWNDNGSVLSWGPTNPTSRLVATVKQTPQPLSSPQAWADSRALLTWIFKPLSTIRRGTLSAGEVTKFSGSGRNAVVPEHTSCGINPLLPQLTSSTQWHCLTFILDLGSQGKPTCDTKLRGGNNHTNTHMHTKCCRTILCQVSVVDVRSCLWLRHGKVLYSSATLIAVKSIRDFHQLSPPPFEC